MIAMIWFCLSSLICLSTDYKNEMPDWIAICHILIVVGSLLAAIIVWEVHKSRVEKLEKEVERLKEKGNGK